MQPVFRAFVVILVGSGPLQAQIDDVLAKKAVAARVRLAASADDAEFLRRISLDLTGEIPSSEQVDLFCKDPSADKRQKLIDQFLNSPLFARRWAEWFHIILMERLGENPDWQAYLEDAFQSNKPWDRMVREMLRADATEMPIRGANFFLAKRLENYGQNPVDYSGLTRDVGRLFLGKNFQCCECHDHLTVEEYKQRDFQGLHAFFRNLSLGDAKTLQVVEKPTVAKLTFASVFEKVEMMTGPALPGSAMIPIPKFASGDEYAVKPNSKTKTAGIPKFRTLVAISEQLPIASNQDFARNIVNRVWFALMGRGLVHPLDLHHAGNPPSHPEILQDLSERLIRQRFDLKWLIREIVSSAAYQRSSLVPDSPAPRADLFAVALEKRLSPEQFYRALVKATGSPPSLSLRAKIMKAYANPPREPEEEITPSLQAALLLLNDPEVLQLMKPSPGNLANRLESLREPKPIAEELYRAVLSRNPTPAELEIVQRTLGKRGPAAIPSLIWALVASHEFAVNH